MRVPFTEPTSPRYLHINPDTNQIHVLVPIVGGQEISTDNTCQVMEARKIFFEGGALQALNAYKDAILFDIALLPKDDAARQAKEVRLAQIDAYLDAIRGMRMTYPTSINVFLAKEINLYAIQLRPKEPDSNSHVVNPVFSINRRNDAEGNPRSVLYQAIHAVFPRISITTPRTRLTTEVLNALPKSPSFEVIQRILGERCRALFDVAVDFTINFDGDQIDKIYLDKLIGFDEKTTGADYVDALLNACAPNLWKFLPICPFYNIPEHTLAEERTEHLSMITQFFLATLNVYCKARELSDQNFGKILDDNSELSDELVNLISETLSLEGDVAAAVCTFCNHHASELELNRALMPDDLTAIRQKFERTYRTIAESPHLDDFMMLDLDAEGDRVKCVTHQGAICVNFAEIVDQILPNQDFFETVRNDFKQHFAEILPPSESIPQEVEVNPETLINLPPEQFDRLPDPVKNACRAELLFQLRAFLHDAATGKQEEAEALLRSAAENVQILLTTPDALTDYSGRTFNCTAYEYAYWAKDTHMCSMLTSYMDDETKAFLSASVEVIEDRGLEYWQHGKAYCSPHVDLTPLKTALQVYVDGYQNWTAKGHWDAIENAWMLVGRAQRDVPAHVAQEYCRNDRSFDPCPSFHEPTLPRHLNFYNWITNRSDAWFPLKDSKFGPGFNFAFIRGSRPEISLRRNPKLIDALAAQRDLAAVTRLDDERTTELTRLREHLSTIAHGLSGESLEHLLRVDTNYGV